MAYLAFAHKILHRAGYVFDRHVRVDAVLIEQVDAVGLQAPKGGLYHLPDMFRPAVHASLHTVRAEVEPELGRHDHTLAQRAQCFADELLVAIWTVGLRGVEHRDTALDRATQQADRLTSI